MDKRVWYVKAFGVAWLITVVFFMLKWVQIGQTVGKSASYFFGPAAIISLLLLSGIRKPWIRYAVNTISITSIYATFMIWWIIGLQFVLNNPFVWQSFVISILCIVFFNRPQMKEYFGLEEMGKLTKILVILILGLVVISAFSYSAIMAIWMIHSSKPLVVSVKKEYVYRNEFLNDKNAKKQFYNIKISVPAGFQNFSAGLEDLNNMLSYSMLSYKNNVSGARIETFVSIYSKSSTERTLKLLVNFMGFRSSYEYDRKTCYPGPTLFFRWIASASFAGSVEQRNKAEASIEDVAAPSWKGFVRIRLDKESDRWIIVSSLYDLKSDSSVEITIGINKDSTFTLDQARALLASVEFVENLGNTDQFYSQGKTEMDEGDFQNAIIDLANASYISQQKGEPDSYKYAYSLASCLNKAKKFIGAKDFLDYALKQKPDYAEAKALLSEVEKTFIKKIKPSERSNEIEPK